MLDHPEHGLRPVGFVDVVKPGRPERLCVPVVGDVADLPKIAAEERVHDIVVTFSEMRDDELVEVLRACDRLGCEIHVVPRLFELGFDESGLSQLWGTQLLRLRRGPFRTRVWALKRALDVTLAAAALVLAGPLMLVLALLLRLELGPGVLFRQKRTGIDGRPFELLKFRTLSPVPDGATSEWSVADVDRMGPVGHFLRRSSLDELPQLWNVVKGQMSLVGPRPEQPQYVTQFAREYNRYHARLRLPAGVTGWAQIHDLRGATSLEDRVRFDNYYIENWSLWWDLKILFRTVLAVLRMRGG